VVSPTPVAGIGRAESPLVERARLDSGVVYEVRWTPEAIAALDAATTTLAPPPAGGVPFRDGEVAVYNVFWEGGPLDVTAGTATLSAQATSGGWRFEARAETAPWVESFFQARDRFVTTTDRDLLPLEHQREIREGRRRLDRTYVFEREHARIRVGATSAEARAGEALTLPLGAAMARDAVSALYYMRTLPLEPRTVINVPLNEAGTSLVLQVATGTLETIEIGGRRRPAFRLDPRVMRRIERRRPLIMSIWLSTDEPRVPLKVLVDAGFGRLHAELVEYRR
jgi:Protein of unknown function (DUF3108)